MILLMRCIPNWWEGHGTGIPDKEGTEICEGDILSSIWPKGNYIVVWEPRDAGFRAYVSEDMLHCDLCRGMATGQWRDAFIINRKGDDSIG